MTPFGLRVRELRTAKGVTLKEMALALGVSSAYLSALEHGRRGRPTRYQVQRICEYFNIIWDDAEELERLATLSHPRVTVDTAGLGDVIEIPGLGSIGLPVARALQNQGVRVIASDLAPITQFESVETDRIYETECGLFSPCATGGILDRETIDRLQCRVICGGANNPLASDQGAEQLRERGILYIPDFISNSGATIHGASLTIGEEDRIETRFQAVPTLLREIIEEAEKEQQSPHFIATSRADGRIASLR